MNPDYQNMWTGNMTGQGDSFPPQWTMNSSTPYMNMPHEQVDWASLAQQWIKMKEEIPASNDKEGGEAPMEIIKEESLAANTAAANADWHAGALPDGATWSANWGWDQNNGWCWNATPKPPPAPTYSTAAYTAALVTPESTQTLPPQTVFPYTATTQPPPATETFSSSTPAYWTGTVPETKESWGHNHVKKKEEIIDTPPELDAAKRKQLPAWIREGLEKMEREKQKKAEHEKMERLRKEELSKKNELFNLTNNGAGSNGEPQIPKKSKFESDSESEPEVTEPLNKIEETQQPRRSRFDWAGPPQPAPKPVYRTKEQILQACMVDVRKILTQILMEVTTEEIRKAVEETHRKMKKKAPAATIRKTPALTSLTGKLGLGIYESDSDSESEPEKVTDPDSDQEIHDRIERLKSEFTRVEQHIEREALEQEERERKQLQVDTVSNDGSPNDTEEQVQPINEGSTVSKSEKYSYDPKKERSNDSHENTRDSRESYSREKKVKRSEYRNRSYSSSTSSSSDSRSPSPYYKRKHKHHRDDRKSKYSRSRSRSRSRDRRHKRKSSRHRSSSRKRRQRSNDRRRRGSSSSSSGGRHNRKSHRR